MPGGKHDKNVSHNGEGCVAVGAEHLPAREEIIAPEGFRKGEELIRRRETAISRRLTLVRPVVIGVLGGVRRECSWPMVSDHQGRTVPGDISAARASRTAM